MAKILAIKAQPGKGNTGKVLVIIDTPEKTHFVPLGQWNNKCKNPLDSYIGGEFNPTYFQKGDMLLNGQVATDSGVILEDFIASVNPEVAGYAQAVQNQLQMDKLTEMNTLFQRKKAEQRAQSEENVKEVVPAGQEKPE